MTTESTERCDGKGRIDPEDTFPELERAERCDDCNGTGKLPAREPDVAVVYNPNGIKGWYAMPHNPPGDPFERIPGLPCGPYPTEAAALEAARKASR